MRLRPSDALRALPRRPMCGLRGALIACVLLWSDHFPINAPHQRLYQEGKVEFCGATLFVETRVMRKVHTAAGPEREPVGDWSRVTTRALRIQVEGE